MDWKSDFIEFGKRLRQLREAKNFTASEVAQALKVPITTYREWENGRAIRGLPYVRIAEILQVSLTELMTGEKSERKELFEQLEQIERLIFQHRKSLQSFF